MGAFDGTNVLRISVPGSNVLSTTLADKFLAFDSRWGQILTVHATGTISVANGATVSVVHSCGFIPFAGVWAGASNGIIYARDFENGWVAFRTYSDRITIGNTSGGTISFRYLIFSLEIG